MEANKFLFDNLRIKPQQHLAVFPVNPVSVTIPSGFSATLYLQFHADPSQDWKYLGYIGEGKESAIFRVTLPVNMVDSDHLGASLGILIVPTSNIPASTDLALTTVQNPVSYRKSVANDSLQIAKKLLDNFISYALSFSRTFVESGHEAFIPAKIITDWYNSTVKKTQLDPEGFLNRLMKSSAD